MQEVISTKPHKYADRQRLVGERYSVEDKLLPAMKHLGWVEPYDEKKHGAKAQVASAHEQLPAQAARLRAKATARKKRK